MAERKNESGVRGKVSVVWDEIMQIYSTDSMEILMMLGPIRC